MESRQKHSGLWYKPCEMPSKEVVAAMQNSRYLTGVVLTLEYWREYRTLFHIAQDWGIHESTAQRTVKRIEEFLIKSKKFRLPSQRELSKQSSEIKRVIIDVAETEIERPKKNRSATIVASKSAIR